MVALMNVLLSLAHQDVLASIAGCGLLTHLTFNRLEPLNTPALTALLVVIPSALSCLLVIPHNYSVFSALFTSFLVYHTVLLSSVAVYRLSPWHPLANYPGPVALKLSRLFVVPIALKGKRHEYIQSLHERYKSDYVRIGPNELSVRDPAAVGPVMGISGLPKGPGHDGRARFQEHRGLLNWRDPVEHAKRRKPWSRGTNTAALKEYEPAMAKRVAQLGETILTRREAVVETGKGILDVAECIKHFAYDFMYDIGFGGGSEIMRNGDPQGMLAALHNGLVMGMVLESLPWLSYHIEKLPAFSRKAQGIRQVAARMARERILKGTVVKDLFHYLNNEDRGDSAAPSLETVATEGFVVVLAGSDTTSTTMSNVIYLLMKHPEVYKRLQEEVDKYYPPGEDALDCKHHPKMTYMDAVLNETLRLYPVQPSGSHRGTVSQGLVIGSNYIPPNTGVRVHTYSMQRDSRNFSPATTSFYPDRWFIAEDASSYSSSKSVDEDPFVHNPNAFIPFSFGPANCVGKSMALKEMKMVLCHLTQKLEFKLPSETELDGLKDWEGWYIDGRDPWEAEMKDFFAVQVGRLPAFVRERNT